ncbi:MAG: hypothetical protein RR614_09455 [Eubacterium sp.]
MIKIGVPENFDRVKPYFEDPKYQRDLYITAMSGDELQVVVRFKYRGNTVDVYEIIETVPKVAGAVLDGVVRTLLFQMMDADCTICRFHCIPDRMTDYFKNHGFIEGDGYMEHQDFANEFFKPCPGCGGSVD